jgi:DNA-binding transcriptional LysR family regulator
MLGEMELRHLRYFVAVAEEENVSRAALKLHVSQPGISRQIHDLEDELGFQLFERSAKSVRLTGAGKVFLTEARVVLQHADDAVKKGRAAAGGTNGEINVGYAPSLTVQILPQALRKFQEQYPKVRVALHDLGSEMVSQVREKNVAVAPKHPLAKLKFISLEQISREPIIVFSRKDYPEIHEYLAKIFAPVGRVPRIAGEHDGISSLIADVEAGRGFALVTSSVACMAGPRLKLIPLKPALPPISVGAVWCQESETELVKNFIAAARQIS